MTAITMSLVVVVVALAVALRLTAVRLMKLIVHFQILTRELDAYLWSRATSSTDRELHRLAAGVRGVKQMASRLQPHEEVDQVERVH